MFGLQRKRKIYIANSQMADEFEDLLRWHKVDFKRGHDKGKGFYFIVGKQRFS